MSDGEPEGATPADADEAADLLPSHIHTRDELNLGEQQNILAAARWALSVSASVLSKPMIGELHRRMFDRTWRWMRVRSGSTTGW